MNHWKRMDRRIALICVLWARLNIVNGSTEIELAEGIEIRKVGMPGEWNENVNLLQIQDQNEQVVPPLQIDLRAHQCKALAISNCSQVFNLVNLTGEEAIEYCFVSNCDQLQNLEFLREFKHAKYLQISGCNSLKPLEGIQHLKALKQIAISKCKSLGNWRGCSRISGLTSFEARECPLLTAEHIGFLAPLKKLSVLAVEKCERLNRLDGVSKLQELRSISIRDCPVEDISSLLGKRKLELLDLRGTAVRSLTGLAAPLRTAVLENNVRLESIQDLGTLSSITKFQCDHLNGFSDLNDLDGNSTIAWLKVPASFISADISSSLPNLRTVVIRAGDSSEVSKLKRAHSNITFILEGSAEESKGVGP